MFDFGEEVYHRPPAFKLWPTEGDFTALIDADLLPYIVGFTTGEEKYAKARIRVEEQEVGLIKDTPECLDAMDHLDRLINEWVSKAKSDSAIFYVTHSEGNFRLDVAFTKPYKGQRQEEKPPFYAELKDHLIKNHNAIVATEEEADDLIVTEMHRRNLELEAQGAEIGSPEAKRFADCIAVSSDKDLRISPGWHYDPMKMDTVWVDVVGWLDPEYKVREVNDYEFRVLCRFHDEFHEDCEVYSGSKPCEPQVFVRGKRAGENKTKRVKVGRTKKQYVYKLRGAGLLFFYSQLITGDNADNYPGIPGVGDTGALEVLDSCKNEEEMYEAVLQEYTRVYGEGRVVSNYRGGSCFLTPEQLMAEQGRLAHMRRTKGEVWNPGVYCPGGGSEEWRS